MGGGSKTEQQQHTVTKNEIPKWVEDAGRSNYDLATSLANKPYQPYQGQLTAGTSDMTTQGEDYLKNNVGSTAGMYGAAGNAIQGLLGFNSGTINADQVQAGSIPNTDLSKYLNPYTNEVVDKSMADLDNSRLKSLNDNASRASAAGAFGGSRSAIVDAVTNSETARQSGLLSSQLRSDAYDKATGLATTDLNRAFQGDTTNAANNLTAAQANESNKLAAGGLVLNAGTTLGQLAGSQQQAYLSDAAALAGAGGAAQGREQQKLDALRAEWDLLQGHDKDALNLRLASLGMTPYSTTQTTDGTTTKESSGGTDWATTILGGVKAISGLASLSDDNMKEDITKLGEIPDKGLNAYAFRYKGDPKTYPKSIGLMASEVEKVMPDAVSKVNGVRFVNYQMALGSEGRA